MAMMGRAQTAALIWALSFTLFYFFFQMAFRDTSQNHPSSPYSDSFVTYLEQSSRLYDSMATDLEESGPKFLKQGQTSQSLTLSDLFTLKDGSVTPILKAANPPVRANVLHLGTEYSIPISEAVKREFGPYFDKIWFQDSNLYHFSMFHSSHHISSVPATEDEIESEASAVKAVADGLCPFDIVLDRVILTPTGVLLGCWKVNSGTNPITIRSKLRAALPHAPEKQLYDPAILHTSLARLLGTPKSSDLEDSSKTSDSLQLVHDLVARLKSQIHGFKAVISELWYVEEYDVLALALNGRMKVRRFPFGCKEN